MFQTTLQQPVTTLKKANILRRLYYWLVQPKLDGETHEIITSSFPPSYLKVGDVKRFRPIGEFDQYYVRLYKIIPSTDGTYSVPTYFCWEFLATKRKPLYD